MFKRVKEVLDRTELFNEVRPDVEKWIQERGIELFSNHAKAADSWLTATLLRRPENEPIADRERMFIWVAAMRMAMVAPKRMNPEQFQAWIFSLLSMGYVMRIDHESNTKKDDTNNPGLPPSENPVP
jgi:hypothetical protein